MYARGFLGQAVLLADRVIKKLNLHSHYYSTVYPNDSNLKKTNYRPLLLVKSQVDVCKASDVQ